MPEEAFRSLLSVIMTAYVPFQHAVRQRKPRIADREGLLQGKLERAKKDLKLEQITHCQVVIRQAEQDLEYYRKEYLEPLKEREKSLATNIAEAGFEGNASCGTEKMRGLNGRPQETAAHRHHAGRGSLRRAASTSIRHSTF